MSERASVANLPSRTDRLGGCAPPTPRGFNREMAAGYVGVSPSLFDEMVRDGRMPKPKRINARTVWDRRGLDRAFDILPGGGAADDDEGEWEAEL